MKKHSKNKNTLPSDRALSIENSFLTKVFYHVVAQRFQMIRDARLSCRKPNQSGSGYWVTCIEEVYLPAFINTSLLPRLQNTNSVALRQTELALSRVSQLVANGAA